MRFAAVFIIASLLATAAAAQSIDRAGVWFGGGLAAGYAAIDCSECGALVEDDPWEGGLGLSGSFGVGRTILPRLQAGADVSFWARRSDSPSRHAALASAGIGGRYYPWPGSGLHATAVLGVGGSVLGGESGHIEAPGLGFGAGLGYDISLGRSLAISPYLKFVQIVGDAGSGRNEGEDAEGPATPAYAQFGIALMRY